MKTNIEEPKRIKLSTSPFCLRFHIRRTSSCLCSSPDVVVFSEDFSFSFIEVSVVFTRIDFIIGHSTGVFLLIFAWPVGL